MNDKLFQLFQKAVSQHGVAHILIMGDFNMPEIKWNNMYYVQVNNETAKIFFYLTHDLFLGQHSLENTRFKPGALAFRLIVYK